MKNLLGFLYHSKGACFSPYRALRKENIVPDALQFGRLYENYIYRLQPISPFNIAAVTSKCLNKDSRAKEMFSVTRQNMKLTTESYTSP